MPDVTHQPLPGEFDHKRSLFDRWQSMAAEMQRHRRAMGYVWLEGGITTMDDGATDDVIVHARQSGLILLNVFKPKPHLHIEHTAGALALSEFHRSIRGRAGSDGVAEFRWDEAMLTDRMA